MYPPFPSGPRPGIVNGPPPASEWLPYCEDADSNGDDDRRCRADTSQRQAPAESFRWPNGFGEEGYFCSTLMAERASLWDCGSAVGADHAGASLDYLPKDLN